MPSNFFQDVGVNKDEWDGKSSGSIIHATTFMAQYTAPDYVIDGIIQRSRIYSLTSPTGHGKTAVSLFLAFMVATGCSDGPIQVTQGAVVILAGENPDDVRARFWACCSCYGVNAASLPIYVLPMNVGLDAKAANTLKDDIDGLQEDIALVIVDTAAAFFPGDDENANVQMGNYARVLRTFLECQGKPAVLIPAHPLKHADKDMLLPRGGGGFLAEVDGNLTLWSGSLGKTTTLHWQGKIRGADFNPINFSLQSWTTEGVVDSKGRPLPSVVAKPQSEAEAVAERDQAISDENVILGCLMRSPGVTVSNIAFFAGWLDEHGEPMTSKVYAGLDSLRAEKFVKLERRKYWITESGKRELDKVGYQS